MRTLIALLRGVNVGGRVLPMTSLAAIVEAAGGRDVRTYIQSGNVVFRAKDGNVGRLARRITEGVGASHGYEPHVIVLTREQLASAAAANPFPDAAAQGKWLHLFFLDDVPPRPDLDGLRALATKTERFALDGRVFYLHTPDGMGKSKLAARAEKLLGVPATARNWNTVTTLLAMAAGDGSARPAKTAAPGGRRPDEPPSAAHAARPTVRAIRERHRRSC